MQAEAQQQFRQTPEDIGRLYVRGANNEMVPVSSLVTTTSSGARRRRSAFQRVRVALVHRDAQAGAQHAAR